MLQRYDADFEAQLQDWLQAKILRPLDVALLRAIPASQQLPGALRLYLMLASAQLAQGHLCLDFVAAAQDPLQLLPAHLRDKKAAVLLRSFCRSEPPAAIAAALAAWPALVSSAADAGAGAASSVFVLKGQRLYLRRYALAEQQIADFIEKRVQQDAQLRQQLPLQQARTLLQLLFNKNQEGDSGPNWQQQACALAASSSFAVITGGPGTGKTTTVLKLLLLLSQLSAQPLQMILAAPTGKAAARLTESLNQNKAKLLQQLNAAADTGLCSAMANLPHKASTVHRLLGPTADGGFRYGPGCLLPADVVIVDEASMLDASLLAALVQALPPQCRLILLGDKDQLASVEAGAVLAEICKNAGAGGYASATAQWLAQLTGVALPSNFVSEAPAMLDQQVMMLRTSHRFASDSGIGRLAALVNQGDLSALQQFWQQDWPDVATQTLAQSASGQLLARQACQQLMQLLLPYRHLVQKAAGLQPAAASTGQAAGEALVINETPAAAEALAQFARQVHQQFAGTQLLCAVRQGPAGVETINQLAEQLWLADAALPAGTLWYPGRPVIVLQNDYSTGLMNGDIGICLPTDGPAGSDLRVAFLSEDHSGGVRWVLPGRLPAVETAFALTVHKSQGSEFGHTILLLPSQPSPVLTRELVYTAITRARQRFSLWLTDWSIWQQAVQSQIQRNGGLRL